MDNPFAGSGEFLNLTAALAAKTEKTPPSSSSSLHGALGYAGAVMFSTDIGGMLNYPPVNSGHRRSHSENLGFPYGFRFDGELRVAGSGADGASSDDTDEDVFPMFMDTGKLEADLPTAAEAPAMNPADVAVAASERPARIRHKRSLSAEGSSAIRAEMVITRNRGSSRVDSNS